jgi:hypothetical protein
MGVNAVPITGNYSYQWSTSANPQTIISTSSSITAFNGTEYCVTVTDGGGCVSVDCFNVPSLSFDPNLRLRRSARMLVPDCVVSLIRQEIQSKPYLEEQGAGQAETA